MIHFLVIFEQTSSGFSAYSPDFPGCIATGSTHEEVEKNMLEAVRFHIEGMKIEKLPIPNSSKATAEKFAVSV